MHILSNKKLSVVLALTIRKQYLTTENHLKFLLDRCG